MSLYDIIPSLVIPVMVYMIKPHFPVDQIHNARAMQSENKNRNGPERYTNHTKDPKEK